MSGTVDQHRVITILAKALAMEPGERPAYLEEACLDDTNLRAEVEELLVEEDSLDENFLELPAALDQALPTQTSDPPKDPGVGKAAGGAGGRRKATPKTIGPYRILRILGKGGMGTVFLGEQKEPIRRRVALKVLDSLHNSRSQKRFAAEGRALARLNHPNIAALYEVGITDNDHPFVAMEVVEGSTIIAFCNEKRLDIQHRIYLFLGVCAGVRHAHEKRILHRDLKPSNILVSEVDGRPTAKVIDFGIAQTLDAPLFEDPRMTLDHHLVGSPAYMSPEAATFGRKELDTRSDVYSLGLVLYELLVGVPPRDTNAESFASLLRRIAEENLPTPSSRFACLETSLRRQLAGLRGLREEALKRLLRGDLGAIILKATAHQREERYSSPADLAADLGHYLRTEPIEARPPTRTYLMRRFLRRRLGTVLAVSLLIAALAAGYLGRTLEAHRASQALEQSEELSSFLIGLLELSDPSKALGEAVTARDLLDRGAEEIQGRFEEQPLTRARFMTTIGKIYTSMGLYDRAEPLLRESLALAEPLLPPDGPEIAHKLDHLGVLFRLQGRFAEAEPLCQRALAIREREAGPGRLDLTHALQNLARVYLEQGQYGKAEPYYQRALDILDNGSSDRQALASALDGLGAVHYRLGRDKQAEIVRSRALRIREEVLGADHPEVATSLNNLAVLFKRQGRQEEALLYLRRSLAIREKVLGPNHPYVASSLNNLGTLLLEQGDLEGAANLLIRSLAIKRQTLAANHPQIANTLQNLAEIFQRQDRLNEAESLLRETIEIRAITLGDDNIDTLRAHLHLAEVLRGQGQFEAAENHYRRTLDADEKTLPREHEDFLKAISGYRELLRQAGRQADLEALEARHQL